jgi:hypothetical protein
MYGKQHLLGGFRTCPFSSPFKLTFKPNGPRIFQRAYASLVPPRIYTCHPFPSPTVRRSGAEHREQCHARHTEKAELGHQGLA